MVVYSHYDGVKESWPYPGSDRVSAKERLARLQCPQFICHERDGVEGTRRYVEELKFMGNFTFRQTGFRNLSAAWVLRPSPAREELREWFRSVLADPMKTRKTP